MFGGLQTGYDRRFGTWVLGVVAAGSPGRRFLRPAGARRRRLPPDAAVATEGLPAKVAWFGTVRGKAGFAMGDWLAYGTGGLAYGNTDSSYIGFLLYTGWGRLRRRLLRGAIGSEVKGRAGAPVLGISKAFAGDWNVGVEYLHIDLGRSSVTGLSTTGRPSDHEHHAEPALHRGHGAADRQLQVRRSGGRQVLISPLSGASRTKPRHRSGLFVVGALVMLTQERRRSCSPDAVRVPELTCATNIKLNMRVSLRPIQTRLAWL